MKKILIVLFLIATAAHAGKDRGGGDICENRIKVVSQELKLWIQSGALAVLDFPLGISMQAYSQRMLSKISTTTIKCVSRGDEGFPVTFEGIPKTCIFDEHAGEGEITCDYNKFLTLPGIDQRALVHHEYAGLARLESPNGSDSNYELTNLVIKHWTQKSMIRSNKNRCSIVNDVGWFRIQLDKINVEAFTSLAEAIEGLNELNKTGVCDTNSRCSISSYSYWFQIYLDNKNLETLDSFSEAVNALIDLNRSGMCN